MKIAKGTFIVTGGASGLGEAVSRRIVKAGGNVVMFDLDEKAGKKLQDELGSQALFCKVNVVKEESVQQGINEAVQKFGGLNGAIQCAGVGNPKRVITARGEVHDLKTFEMVVAINLIGTFNVLRLAVAQMVKQEADANGERGVFIHVSSVAAFEGQIGQAAYSASKGGVNSMTLPLARDLAGKGIRVNTIAPGIFDTPMMAKLPEKARQSLGQQVPFPARMGQPAEFADLAAHIIENQYLNGTIIRLDGSIRMAAM